MIAPPKPPSHDELEALIKEARERQQLSAASHWNGATGTLVNFFSIANRSGTACSLPHGRPVVLLTWRDSLLNVQESGPNNQFGVGPGAKLLRTLAPGQSAAVYMQWSNWCGRDGAQSPRTAAVPEPS